MSAPVYAPRRICTSNADKEIPDPQQTFRCSSLRDREGDTGADLRCRPNESLIALVRQVTGQELPSAFPEADPSSVASIQADSSSSTLVESSTPKGSDEGTEPDAAVDKIDKPLPSVSPNQVGSTHTFHEAILYTAFYISCQTARFAAIMVASLISSLNGLHSALAQAGR